MSNLQCSPWGWNQRNAQGTAPPPEPDSGGVVCAPNAYLFPPEDCLPLGPSIYLTNLAKLGLAGLPTPLPAFKPDASLAQIPFRYFQVITTNPLPVVSSPGATSGIETFYPGFVYIAYGGSVNTGHGIYYELQNGGWILGRGQHINEVSAFQGLQFKSTPRNSFGWTFEDIPVMTAPGYNAAETGQRLAPFTVVQIYDTQTVGGADWNLIGPDEWVEARKVAQVVINTKAPDGSNSATRWIDVNLAEQTLAVYDNNQLVFATVIASGLDPFWTRPGLFTDPAKETNRDHAGQRSNRFLLSGGCSVDDVLRWPAGPAWRLLAHTLWVCSIPWLRKPVCGRRSLAV